jgi:hypothetical protein
MPTFGDPSPDTAGFRLERTPQPEPQAPRWFKRGVIWLVLAALILAGLSAYLLAGRPSQAQKQASEAAVPTAAVRVGTVERIIRVAGQTSAKNFAVLTVPILRGQGGRSGLSLTKLVAGGSRVKTGDIVAQVDQQTYIEQLDDLDANIAQADADLRRLKAQQALDWESLQQSLRSGKSAADKATLDYKAASVKPAIEQELLKLDMDEAVAAYKQSLASEAFRKTSFECSLRVQEISYARQQTRRQRLATDIDHFTFRATMDGLAVVQTFVRSGSDMAQYQVGDSVSPGQSFLRIVDTASMRLEGSANQAESSELRVGQPATITLDAFPGLRFSGKVYSMGAMAASGMFGSYYSRSIPLTVQIQGEDSRLIPDLSAAADILVGRKENVLVVPVESVRSENGTDYVFVRTAQGFEKRQVEIGLQGAAQVEVRSGLSTGDQVALTVPKVAGK